MDICSVYEHAEEHRKGAVQRQPVPGDKRRFRLVIPGVALDDIADPKKPRTGPAAPNPEVVRTSRVCSWYHGVLQRAVLMELDERSETLSIPL